MRLRYEEHTWPELRELGKRDDLVVVIPTATLEDHGYHLPIDTDARLVSAICERAVEASGGLGRSEGAHGPDEWCEVDGLRRFMHMAYDTVEELATR